MAAQVKCITLSARDLAELLGISRSAAYALFHREDFPTLKIGRRLLVTHDALVSIKITTKAKMAATMFSRAAMPL